MDPLVVGTAFVAVGAALATAVANWRLGRRTDAEVKARALALAQKTAKAYGLEVSGELRWVSQRGGRRIEVELVPLQTSHRLTPQSFRTDVRATPLKASTRAAFRLSSLELPGLTEVAVELNDRVLRSALSIRGSNAADVELLLGNQEARGLLRSLVTKSPEGFSVFSAERIVLDDDGLHIKGLPPPPPSGETELTQIERVVAAAAFAEKLATSIDDAHDQAPRRIDHPDDQSAAGTGSSIGIRAL
jgi:hypothetical protein